MLYSENLVIDFRMCILLSLSFLVGCRNIPDFYTPPVQRKPPSGTGSSPLGHLVDMSDPNADAYIVGDVDDGLEMGSGRWTRKRPELRFFLGSVEHLNFKADLSIAETTLRDTGPVAISIFINENLLDTMKCSGAGEKHFDRPVPAKFLRAGSVNFAALEIDKLWVSKNAGAELGFILTRAGFTP
jgi:hypothetical protein